MRAGSRASWIRLFDQAGGPGAACSGFLAVAVLFLVPRPVRLSAAVDDLERGLSKARNASRVPCCGERRNPVAGRSGPRLRHSCFVPGAVAAPFAGAGSGKAYRHLRQALRHCNRHRSALGVWFFAYVRWLRPAVFLPGLAVDELLADGRYRDKRAALRATFSLGRAYSTREDVSAGDAAQPDRNVP